MYGIILDHNLHCYLTIITLLISPFQKLWLICPHTNPFMRISSSLVWVIRSVSKVVSIRCGNEIGAEVILPVPSLPSVLWRLLGKEEGLSGAGN